MTEKSLKADFKNILVVRTDRIGDVVLTTPSIIALREAFPSARISIMVTSQTRDIVEGNPFLDEVIVYDREGLHRGFLGFWRLIRQLRTKRFDLAVIFHTKKRTNLICSLGGIPKRIGYRNEKFGFLLTDSLEDTRARGEKHEAQYCLDVLKIIGVHSDFLRLTMPLKKESEDWVNGLFKENNILFSDQLVAIHPSSSCISRRWPLERFAEVVDRLTGQLSAKVVIVGGEETQEQSAKMKSFLKIPVIDLTGRTDVSQLASVLKRCRLLISNDSGPTHMAVAVGTPVVSIFGRNQPGLGPRRWKPLGPKDTYLHKNVGCQVCLAHNCQNGFQCLMAISVDEVFHAAAKILKSENLS